MKIFQINEESNFTYSYYKSKTSPFVEPHFYNCYEILFFQCVDAFYTVEGNNYELTDGDILITNPREMHCPVFKTDSEYTRSLIFLKPSYLSEFSTDKYNPFTALEKRKIGTHNKIDSNLVKKFELDKKMNDIGSYYYSNLPEKEIMIKSTLLQLLVSINRIVNTESFLSNSTNIDNIIYYINNNLSEKITLKDLAKEFNLNKYHIAHSFKEKMGLTVIEYIANKRITLSKELILNNIPLTQVSEMVGFNDYSNFYRTFVKVCGIPPTKLKRRVTCLNT